MEKQQINYVNRKTKILFSLNRYRLLVKLKPPNILDRMTISVNNCIYLRSIGNKQNKNIKQSTASFIPSYCLRTSSYDFSINLKQKMNAFVFSVPIRK